MKKCASCTKDLPEAALHCVFCGAKQPPVPAVQGGLAKTAFGYSASDMEQLKQRPAPGSQPPPHMQATIAQPPYQAQQAAGSAPYQNFSPGGGAGHAATMLAPSAQGAPYAPPPARPHPSSQPPPYAPPSPSAGMGIQSARQITPQPLPAVVSDPYLSGPARSGRPVEPWRDSLRVVMFVWGALTLAAFATPLATDPMAFNWDAIIHGEGLTKVMPLLIAAVGMLSLLLAAIPMAALPRGLLAAVLGLSGIVVPLCLIGEVPPWQVLVELVGMLALVCGLLVRHAYVDSLVGRVIVTVGVVCALLLFLVPSGGEIPLVQIVKALIDAEGAQKVGPALTLGMIAIVVLALLAWMPGPATAGSKVLAWLLILWPTLVTQLVALLVAGDVGAHVKAAPNAALMAWAPQATFIALAGYGLATVIGKRLE